MYRYLVELLQPHILLYVVMGATIAHMWWKRRETRRRLLFLTVPFMALTLCCLPVMNYLALGMLEWPYPPMDERPAEARAIVVLAGYVKAPDSFQKRPELGADTVYRCIKAAELYHRGEPCPIMVCGGSSDRDSSGPACAPIMKEFLVRMGVRAADVMVEANSLTTHENAVEAGKLLKERGIRRVVLVTDATHLFRALACFRKQGIDVVPCGCRYRATELDPSILDFVPNPAAARHWEVVWHEWLGVAWYWIRGRM
jgi:uncharacterized SAM-binding protein YcdF (DUF218 family)